MALKRFALNAQTLLAYEIQIFSKIWYAQLLKHICFIEIQLIEVFAQSNH